MCGWLPNVYLIVFIFYIMNFWDSIYIRDSQISLCDKAYYVNV